MDGAALSQNVSNADPYAHWTWSFRQQSSIQTYDCVVAQGASR